MVLPGRRSASRRRASSAAAAESVAATVAASVSASRTPGVLYDYTVAIETTTVELIDRVLGIAGVVKFHESVTTLDDHIANATVAWRGRDRRGRW